MPVLHKKETMLDMTSSVCVKLAVLGGEKVGKSAVTVRFLTRRFIGEYDSDTDKVYRSRIHLDDSLASIEIMDTSATNQGTKKYADKYIEWGDAFIVVYSICDRKSFNTAKHLMETIRASRAPSYVPILLLGNKSDLDHGREVEVQEGHEISLENGCQFYEVSAAESYLPISIAYHSVLREVRSLLTQKCNSLKRRRRNSLRSMSKAIASMFGAKHKVSAVDVPSGVNLETVCAGSRK